MNLNFGFKCLPRDRVSINSGEHKVLGTIRRVSPSGYKIAWDDGLRDHRNTYYTDDDVERVS
jgi:hypothetical protein